MYEMSDTQVIQKTKEQMQKTEKLNREFDDKRLQAKWALEDMVNSFENFRTIFISEAEADKVKAYLIETLVKINKL
jgi:hypothetical protein